jgi:hypothetical protein
MLASPVFKAMLKHGFLEGSTLRAERKVEIPLPDDDPVCFAVLMDIVHGNREKVPREISFHFMLAMAILVDKYRLQECVSEYSDMWIDAINATIPKSFTNDLPHWLCVSWVFRRPIEFAHVTRILERESNGQDLDTFSGELNEELPIPERIIRMNTSLNDFPAYSINSLLDTILERRERAIRNSFDILQRYNDMLQTGDIRCTSKRPESHRYTCNNVLMSSLLESSTTLGLWPPPDAPYDELTFKNVAHKINQLQIVSFCSHMGYTNQSSTSHGVKAEIGSALEKVKMRLSGLNLRDFD